MNDYPRDYGRYVLLERIGTGGMSHVDLARKAENDASFVRFSAIKRIAPGNLNDDSFLRMFLDEARMHSEMQHANIVQVYDFGKLSDPATGVDEFFMVMEYVPGLDLRALVRQTERLEMRVPLRFTLSVLIEVLHALQYAHTRSDTLGRPMHVVHRDINPRNVMLSVRGEVKIIDFGVAFAADRLEKTQGQSLKGKFAYMSPEQIEANVTLDGRADLFAVGIMLNELVTGRNPFQGLTELQIMHRILMGQVPPIEVPKDYPQARLFHEVQERALATDRDDRYPDADAFRRDLERLAGLIDGPYTTQERAQFLRQLDPHGVQGIWDRLRRYKDETNSSVRGPAPVLPPLAETSSSHSTFNAAPPEALPEVIPEPASRRWGLLAIPVALLTMAAVGVWFFLPAPKEHTATDDAPQITDFSTVQDPIPVAPVAEPTPTPPASIPLAVPDGATAPKTPPPGTHPVSPPGSATARPVATPEPVAVAPVAVEAPVAVPPPVETPSVGSTTPTAPPAAVETGSVLVSSRPQGLDVQVDGRFAGRTPITLKLSVGPHEVRIVMDAAHVHVAQVSIKPRLVEKVTFTFDTEASRDNSHQR